MTHYLITNLKMKIKLSVIRQFALLSVALCGHLFSNVAQAGGTWAPLASGPPVGVNNCLLLSDGTVMGMNGAGQCVRLTPDIHGSYVNGTWTSMPTMNNDRLFFSSDLLTNGNVYVAGGEYGSGRNLAELYNTTANTWTIIPEPPGAGYSDAASKLLPNGNVLQSDSQSGIYIYNAASNVITGGGTTGTGDQNETCWVRMPNDNVLTIIAYGQGSQHYVPSQNAWYADNSVPVPVFGYGGELGAAFALPNGKVLQIGATTNTAIYTSGSNLTSAGTWVAGSGIPSGLGAVDAPAAMMANGKILCNLGPVGGFNGPCSFLEYDYTTDTFTPVGAPGGGSTYGGAPFGTSMLDLPDGSVLFVGGQNSGALYVYTPDGTPLAAGKPIINSLTGNLDGSYHLTGIGLTGISAGAAYGDDEQMDSNYPLVRMTNNATGNVYYARTYRWSSTTIQNTNPVSTEFSVPVNLPAGTYSLVVIANGNPSASTNFVYAPPAAPTGLTGIAGNSQAILSWNGVAGATSYNVKTMVTISPQVFATVATVTGTSCTNLGLVNGTGYYYVVSAITSGGESTNCSPLLVVPFGPPSAPVLKATVIPHNFADAQVSLTWTTSSGASNYNLKRATVHNGPYATLSALSIAAYADTNVLSGKTYYYVVSASGAGGESANSAEVSATVLIATNICLPVTAADVVGSQVTFLAAFSGTNLSYQWQKISGSVTNNIASATGATLILTNLQLTDTASYQVRATNPSGGVFFSTQGALTVGSVPAAVGNIVTTYAAQTGRGNTAPYTNFVPTWTAAAGSLIASQTPSSVGTGDFSQYFTGSVSVLTDGTFGWLNFWLNTGSSPALVTAGSSAGQSVTYTLPSSATGYNISNIVTYGGWGDAGRDQQAYTVYYSTVSAPTNFIQLGTVNYNPANASSVQSATRATLTPASGFLATNVAAVMFDFTTPAPENGFCGYSELGVFGSLPLQQPAPYLLTNTLPVTAVDVAGSQVIFAAAFNSANPIGYQWLRIKNGVTNNIAGATNSALALSNLQLSDSASYQLQASNALGVATSTPSGLTVNSAPAAVNNVITSMAAQLGILGTTYFAPTWTVPSGSLIVGQQPNSVGAGGFSQAGSGTATVLTDGIYGALNYTAGLGGPSLGVTSCGGSAGQSVIYLLPGSATGYNLTNIIVYAGWGDAGRDQQAYTVSYSKITAPTTFITLGSVNYNPANPSGTLSGTRATLTAANGALATNVAAVKFDFTTPAPENGYCGYGEISLFGSPSPQPVRWAVGNANWDTATPNWKSFLTPVSIGYGENNLTALDDSATGSSPITITLTGNHLPSVLTNNSTKTYVLTGGFSIISGSLVKNGIGSLVLDNGAANNFSSIQISNGSLQVGNNDTNGSLGVSAISNSGNLTFNRTDTLNVGNVISGSGAVVQSGSGTVVLSASNTYSGSTIISSGTLALSGVGAIPISAQISISAGATLDASAHIDQTLTLNSGKILKGSGTVRGTLNTLSGSILNPGDTIGALLVQSNVTLNGLLVMELNRVSSPTSDELVSLGAAITGGGTLTVTNLGSLLQAGDVFQLFNQPVAGFTLVNLPDVTPNAWANQLTINGTIRVVATASTNLVAQLTGNLLALSWPADHAGWRLQVQTNDVTQGLGTNWTDVAGVNTTNQWTAPVDLTNGSIFFRMVYP